MKDDIKKTRKRLQELKDLHLTGFVDDAQYAEGVAMLERKLIDAVMNDPDGKTQPGALPTVDAPRRDDAPLKPPPPPARRGPALAAAIGGSALVLALAAYGWHTYRGSAGGTQGVEAIVGLSAAQRQAMSPEQLTAAAARLEQRLQSHPKEVDAWVALARIHTALNRHPDAASAYEKAVALRDNDAALFADFAESRGLTNNGNLGGQPTELVQRALQLDPANLKALSLAATAAFDSKDYAMAVAYWDKIIEVAPADDPAALKAHSNVVEARQLALAPTPTTDETTPPAAAGNGTDIRGTVTLASSLAQRASPTDTVFIYARAVDGPQVPLAVIRKRVKDLPLDFKLDDSMAMWPSAKVSTAGQVIVTARVSKSGDGQAKSGDLQGQSTPVPAGTAGLKVEIGTVVQK